jgi:tetratricopeptide (TPR) repeat protein
VNDELGVAPRVDEGPANALFEKAHRAYEAGRIDDAVGCLEAGIKKYPKAVSLRVQVALLYAKKGLIYEAIGSLETALETDDSHFLGVRNLAIFYQHAGFRNKAAEMWMRALNIAPEESSRAEIKKHLISML